MFDVGAIELLIIVVVAILVIGPKDMPRALRTAGRWIGKIRQVSGHFRAGLDAMIREAEMEEMEKKWREQNARIMADYPSDQMEPLGDRQSGAESRTDESERGMSPSAESEDQPPLPLGKPPAK